MLKYTILALLFVSVLLAGAEAAPYTVDDDWAGADYDNLQDAIDASGANQTIYVHEGNYTGGINVTVSVNIVGNGSNNVTIMNSVTDSAIRISADFVNITGMSITSNVTMNSSEAGIFIWQSEYASIDNVIIYGVPIGIYGGSAHSADIGYAYIHNCTDDGIYFEQSDDVFIYATNCSENERSGIEGYFCDYMTVSWSDGYKNNKGDAADDAGFVFHYCDQLIVSDCDGIDNNRFGILERYGSGPVIVANTMTDNAGEGIYMASAPYCYVAWNTVTWNGGVGYWISNANDGSIVNNTATRNDEHGFQITGTGVWIADNNASQNAWSGFRFVGLTGSEIVRCRAVNQTNSGYDGFNIDTGKHLNFTECVSKGNGRDGFHFVARHGTNMTNNTVAENDRYGIYFWVMNGANITYNEIFNNTNYGLYIGAPVRNVTVHHNNFANNGGSASQALCNNDENNTFNSTDYGNYWSDYNGTGNYSIAGSAGLYDHHPKDKIVQTSAPERVPEFGPLLTISMVLILAVVFRRHRK